MQPWRVVLTRTGNLPSSAVIFSDTHQERTLVFKRRSLGYVLKALAKRGVMTAMIEGGGNLLGQAFSKGLVDEVCFYIAPLISGTGKPVIDTATFRSGSIGIEDLHLRRIGSDIRISGTIPSVTT